jgi:hypothetical protein
LKEKDKHMNEYANESKLLLWLLALVLVGFVFGCDGGGGGGVSSTFTGTAIANGAAVQV